MTQAAQSGGCHPGFCVTQRTSGYDCKCIWFSQFLEARGSSDAYDSSSLESNRAKCVKALKSLIKMVNLSHHQGCVENLELT